MIAEGRYRVKGLRAALGETSKSNEQVGVELELLDHPGQTITWYGYFTDKTIDITLGALRTLGWKGDDLSNLEGIGDNEAYAVVEHRSTEDGKTFAEVRWINRAGGLAMKTALSGDKARAFAERMRGRVIAFDKANGQRGAARPATPAREPGSDDVDPTAPPF